MKHSSVVEHTRKNFGAYLCRLVPSVLSLYALSLSSSVSLLQHSYPVSSPPAERSHAIIVDETAKCMEDLQDETHIALLSEMIESEIPAHPEKSSLASIIVSESRSANMDPLFVAAVVRAESMFRHKAVSRRGAKGLMQIMPDTGRFIARHSNIHLKDSDALHNPETNIKLGIWYLRYLMQRFQGDHERTLVAYNWGPSNLRKAIATGGSYPKESTQYVRKVLSHLTTWSSRRNQVATVQSNSKVG